MVIKYLRINQLFGRYNHSIKFSDGVNIIIGDNGVGKTVCLKILSSIFNGDFGYLLKLEFKDIVISFGKEIWTISKKEIQESNEVFLFDDIASSIKYNLTVESTLHKDHTISEDDVRVDVPSFFDRISDNEWFDRRRGVYVDEKDLFNWYNIRTEIRGLPLWIRRRVKSFSVRIIDTQRIYRNENNGRRSEIGRTISKYVKDISIVINEEQNKASMIASQLDRSFPSRLIDVLSAHNSITANEILLKLVEVDEMNRSLHMVGLTEYKKDSILKSLQKIDTPILTVLSLYADDMKKKLEAFNSIQGKLQLFLSIINSHFTNKKCVLNKKSEFCFETYQITENINKSKVFDAKTADHGDCGIADGARDCQSVKLHRL